ncbi:DUF1543 domain-containing protein [Pseudomonas bijieensis]|uniref:DUF1543 domain-containing protein n=1 Tax=Pseudomonas bijieensis TaxID=2681983 RepID=UPI00200C1DBF|nr:DUF1543 domain-containing protein [Pseudomonas bijieensis]UQI33957.1 DUF1543 domain-containing protein [Pseudomonas bijieensis]
MEALDAFVVMLGGKHPRAKIEVHDIAFVVADTLEAAYPKLRESWFGSPKGVHIDSWMAIDGVESWRVELSPLAPLADSPRLYFINLSDYECQAFGEAHHYLLIVAKDKREVISRGKRQALSHWMQTHTDALLDVDDCLPVDEVGGRYVHLVEGPHAGIIRRNDYIVLS